MLSAGDSEKTSATNALTLMMDQIMGSHALDRILSEFPLDEQERLNQEIESLTRRLNSLIEATAKSHQKLTLDVMLTRLVGLISEALNAERTSLFLFDAETDELYSRVAEGELVNEIRFSSKIGIAGATFQSHEALIIDDAYQDDRFNPSIDEETGYHTKRILAIPVLNRIGQAIGVTEVLNRRDSNFTSADAAVLQAFTTHMATAIENAQLYERQEVTLVEEARFHEVTQAISSELDIDVLLRKIMAIATDLLDAERSTLFLYDHRSHELWSRVAEGIGEKEIRLPASTGIAGEVFRTRQAINIADAYKDPRFNQDVDQKTGYRTESIVAVPVSSREGAIIGVVQVLNRRGGPFRARDVKRLEMLASQSAIALDNARLFSEVLSERNYNNNILRSLTNGVVTVDIHGKVAKINEAGKKILGVGKAALVGAPIEEVFTATNGWLLEAIRSVTETLKPENSLDADLVNFEGEALAVNVGITPLLDAKQQAIGSTIVIEDISNEKRVRSTMARYMTREIADQVLAEGDSVLGGQAQAATVMFADIEDFTGLTEELGASGTVSMLNEYFGEMVEVIFDHHGILDKYIGDAIMAVFGAPFPSVDDADNAVSSAIAMHERLAEFNRERHAKRLEPIKIRIGINSDRVVTGNIGSERRMDYTVIGDGVNVAARLETANKLFGTETLISAATAKLLRRDYYLRELDLLRIRGKKKPVPIFEVLGNTKHSIEPLRQQMLGHFRAGMEFYRDRDWVRAVGEFGTALRIEPTDRASRIFCSRSTHYLEKPPPSDWDGVWSG